MYEVRNKETGQSIIYGSTLNEQIAVDNNVSPLVVHNFMANLADGKYSADETEGGTRYMATTGTYVLIFYCNKLPNAGIWIDGTKTV